MASPDLNAFLIDVAISFSLPITNGWLLHTIWFTSVSYTHLDVYKRQLLGLAVLGFFIRQQSLKNKQKILETEQRLNRARMNPHFFFNALTSLPVSYTHLDVYKRQSRSNGWYWQWSLF